MSDIEIQVVGNDGTVYGSWEDLVAAESNGYLATLILREKAPKGTLFTYSTGPWPTRKDAANARVRMRNRHKREVANLLTSSEIVSTRIHPAWKETR